MALFRKSPTKLDECGATLKHFPFRPFRKHLPGLIRCEKAVSACRMTFADVIYAGSAAIQTPDSIANIDENRFPSPHCLMEISLQVSGDSVPIGAGVEPATATSEVVLYPLS